MRPKSERAPLVLVVDDGDEARELYRACLEYAGFLAETAEDGASAIETAASLSPDLILLDYSMPRMDGGEVLKRLKAGASTRDIPVVMLTAVPDMVAPATKAACGAFLEKPCEPERLLEQIARLLAPRGANAKQAR